MKVFYKNFNFFFKKKPEAYLDCENQLIRLSTKFMNLKIKNFILKKFILPIF